MTCLISWASLYEPARPAFACLAHPCAEGYPHPGTAAFSPGPDDLPELLLIILAWVWIFRTRPGLMLQGIGERPAAAFVRGANVKRLRYLYTVLGGAIIGLAGPAYSLNVKAGWMGTNPAWTASAGSPCRSPSSAAGIRCGQLLALTCFRFLQWLGLVLQSRLPGIPSQVLQVAPFPLMILTLLLVNIGDAEWVARMLAACRKATRRLVAKMLRALRASPPASWACLSI